MEEAGRFIMGVRTFYQPDSVHKRTGDFEGDSYGSIRESEGRLTYFYGIQIGPSVENFYCLDDSKTQDLNKVSLC